MAKIKGVALLSRISILKENHGEETYDGVTACMKPENSERLQNLLSSSWYDAEIYKDLNQSIRKILSGEHPDISETMGELTAESSLKGVYSSKVKANNVRLTLERAATLWRSFHDTGELEVVIKKDENHASLRVVGYALPHEELCDNLIGWGRRLIELSGGKNVVVKKKNCVCNGDEYCENIATWDED